MVVAREADPVVAVATEKDEVALVVVATEEGEAEVEVAEEPAEDEVDPRDVEAGAEEEVAMTEGAEVVGEEMSLWDEVEVGGEWTREDAVEMTTWTILVALGIRSRDPGLRKDDAQWVDVRKMTAIRIGNIQCGSFPFFPFTSAKVGDVPKCPTRGNGS